MSRILGPEFGGSIGIIFAIANAINASLNVVGFCQSIQDLMKNYGGAIIVDGADNDIRIIGTITMIAVCALCGLGAKYEAKVSSYFSHFSLNFKSICLFFLDSRSDVDYSDGRID